MNLKSLEDWMIEKNLKSVPGVVDINPFGGPTREYQVASIPTSWSPTGSASARWSSSSTNNNANAGGSFIEDGRSRSMCARSGLVKDRSGHREHGHHDQRRHADPRQGYWRRRAGSEDPAGPVRHRPFTVQDGKIIDNDDVVSGIAAAAERRRRAAHAGRHPQKRSRS